MWNLIGGVLFGAVGFVAFVHGKRQMLPRVMALGALLMVYPYFVSNTAALYFIGAVLSLALFLWRD
jgi:hypothetical protein